MFHGFGQARFDDGLLLGLSLFSPLPQLLLKTMLDLKVVNIASKIINLLHYSKFVTQSVSGMHNLQPAGQSWPADAFNLALETQNFIYFASFFGKNTL